MTKRNYIFVFICLLLAGCGPTKKTAQIQDDIDTKSSNGYKGNIALKRVFATPLDLNQSRLALQNKLLLEKYAAILSISPDSLNIKLYSFIDAWMNTPYKWGGTNKNGIDCSAFIRSLFNEVYDLKLPRTSLEQVLTQRVERFRSIRYLAEGDILFFKTIPGNPVSHVGFYLRNNKFINSSSGKGVVIYTFNDYWRRRFVTAARVKVYAARKA